MIAFPRSYLVHAFAAALACAGLTACGLGSGQANAEVAPQPTVPVAAAASGEEVAPASDGAVGKPPTDDPDHVTLTPEQRSALAGPDVDGNGVRDDIDAWIASKFPDSAKTRAVWTNEARVDQLLLLATSKAERRRCRGRSRLCRLHFASPRP